MPLSMHHPISTTTEVELDGKFYRALKSSFLWKAGAILEYDDDEEWYMPLNELDVWNVIEATGKEVISARIIENNPEWFERVYPVKQSRPGTTENDIAFGTTTEVQDKYKIEFAPINIK